MTRSSPGVRRMAAILNFMADHPGQAFALTDLVRALKLSRATCHALLTGLVEVGYLYRTSDKSYVLGPALAAIGRIAASNFSPLQVAQPEMRRLADEHDLICTAYMLEKDAVVVRERAAAATHVGYLGPVGTRLKLRFQNAVVFFAWAAEKQLAAWLDAQPVPLSDEHRQDLARGMAFAREHGFSAILRVAQQRGESAELVLGTETADVGVALASDLRDEQSYSLAALVAPVFDQDRKVAFAIGLAGFDTTMPGADILRIAKQLTAACERITRFIAGQQPDTSSPKTLAA